MKRREFITLLGGAAASLSFAAGAQQPVMPVIGFLSPRSPDESAHLVAAFHRGLAETGAVEGQNLAVEYRWGQVTMIVCRPWRPNSCAGPSRYWFRSAANLRALAAKAATATIPIVAVFVDDPVERGMVASLSRPGGNVTGVSGLNGTLEAKRLGLLHEVVPQATTLGFLLNPTFPAAARQLRDMQEAARAIGVQLRVFNAGTDPEIDAAFETIAQQRILGLVVAADTLFVTHRERLVALATRYAVPAMYSLHEFGASGGLMSYGIDLQDLYRNVGVYAGRILKGAKPADLPVMQPTKFDLMINLKTARSLGLTISARHACDRRRGDRMKRYANS